jgi:glutathione S-transferase
MRIHFRPFACSLAARIVVEEAGLEAEFLRVVDSRTEDGRDFAEISPMGYVPALEDGDFVLTEGPAVLAYLADAADSGVLAPEEGTPDRYRMAQWLNFVATELHQGVFHVLLGRGFGEAEQAMARTRAVKPFDVLSAHLAAREFLLDRFSVADAYLLAVLNWTGTAKIELKRWPVLAAYRERLRTRPSVARATAAELPLLRAA